MMSCTNSLRRVDPSGTHGWKRGASQLSDRRLIWGIVLLVSVGVTGCAGGPSVYKMKPQMLETARSDMKTIGVVPSAYRAEIDIKRPPKGPLEGAGKGALYGAAMPPAVGMVIPVPGTFWLGLLLSPVGAVVGGVHGFFTAPPADEVERAEAAVNEEIRTIRQRNLQEELIEQVVKLGVERTGLRFVSLSPELGPKRRDDLVQYTVSESPDMDAILEIRTEEGTLSGGWAMAPPLSLRVELRIRLIRAQSNEVILDQPIICISDLRRFGEWGQVGAQLLESSAEACITSLAEKIIDDLFLVYPLTTTMDLEKKRDQAQRRT